MTTTESSPNEETGTEPMLNGSPVNNIEELAVEMLADDETMIVGFLLSEVCNEPSCTTAPRYAIVTLRRYEGYSSPWAVVCEDHLPQKTPVTIDNLYYD